MKICRNIAFGLIALSLASGCVSRGVYRQLVAKPDANYREIAVGEKDPLEKKMIHGHYDGIIDVDGVTFHTYRFRDFLKGTNRLCEVLLCTSNTTGVIRETSALVAATNAQPSALFFNFHPGYDKAAAQLQLTGSSETNMCLMGFIWEKEGKLCLSPLALDEKGREWYCNILLNRTARSKTMTIVRPTYGIPASILCLSVDIVGIVWTGVSLVINGDSAMESGWYPNLCETLLYD